MKNNSDKNTSSLTKSTGLQDIIKNPYVGYLLLGLALSILPILAEFKIMKSSNLVLIGGVLIYAIVALGLNLLLGFSGLISLGTAGFMGMGAYVSGYLTTEFELPFLVSIAITMVIAVIVSMFVGFVSLRIAGIYLAIATLCVSEILRKTFEEFDQFTGGFSGLTAKYPKILGFKLSREAAYILLVVALVLVMVLTHNLVKGQMGRALHAMRGSEVAAQAMGINLLKYRLIIFALATAYAALGGALYMHFIKFSYPSIWILPMSLNILAVVVIGGLRSIHGTVLGAFVVFAVPDLILKQIPIIGGIDGIAYIFNGVLIILIIMFYPQGVIKIPNDIKNLFMKLFKKGGSSNV